MNSLTNFPPSSAGSYGWEPAVFSLDAKDTLFAINKQRVQSLGKKKPAKPLILNPPKTVEMAYYQALKKLVKYMTKKTNEIIIDKFPGLKELYKAEMNLDGYGNEIVNTVGGIDFVVSRIFEEQAEQVTLSMFQETNQFSNNQFKRQSVKVVGVELLTNESFLKPLANSWTAANVDLIKTIPSQYFNQIEQLVLTNVEKGVSTKELRDSLVKLSGKTEKRCMVIARDQIGKLNGQINRSRSVSAGLTNFIWRTAQDPSVRDSHQMLDNKKFSWEDGADGLFPGQEIQCRCVAINDYSIFY